MTFYPIQSHLIRFLDCHKLTWYFILCSTKSKLDYKEDNVKNERGQNEKTNSTKVEKKF